MYTYIIYIYIYIYIQIEHSSGEQCFTRIIRRICLDPCGICNNEVFDQTYWYMPRSDWDLSVVFFNEDVPIRMGHVPMGCSMGHASIRLGHVRCILHMECSNRYGTCPKWVFDGTCLDMVGTCPTYFSMEMLQSIWDMYQWGVRWDMPRYGWDMSRAISWLHIPKYL